VLAIQIASLIFDFGCTGGLLLGRAGCTSEGQLTTPGAAL
jgi:hypothetical protein